MKVCVVDYGIGNIQSVVNACDHTGAETVVVKDGAALLAARPERVVLPGVGAIGRALEYLRERELEGALNQCVQGDGIPFLGICVGMQVLGEVCEEFGEFQGLGWIPGNVRRLAPSDSGVRLPHVGWNSIEVTNSDDSLLRDVAGKDAYFVHSYVLDCPSEFVLSETSYDGCRFVSSVRRGHIAGVQFHPEKSSNIGSAVLTAFAGKASCTNAV